MLSVTYYLVSQAMYFFISFTVFFVFSKEIVPFNEEIFLIIAFLTFLFGSVSTISMILTSFFENRALQIYSLATELLNVRYENQKLLISIHEQIISHSDVPVLAFQILTILCDQRNINWQAINENAVNSFYADLLVIYEILETTMSRKYQYFQSTIDSEQLIDSTIL